MSSIKTILLGISVVIAGGFILIAPEVELINSAVELLIVLAGVGITFWGARKNDSHKKSE